SANRPFSSKLAGSTSASIRSRAVSFPDWRCFSSLSAPPPSITASRRRFSSSIFSCIAVVVIFRALVILASSISAYDASLRRRHRHLVGVAVQLHVVGDRGGYRALPVFRRRGRSRGWRWRR